MESVQEFKEWLKQDPPSSEIAVSAGDSGRDYMPIAWVETNLDEFDSWSTKNFDYRISRIGDAYFAEGHVELEVCYCGVVRTQVGAMSTRVSSQDENNSYAPTILSLCISNAASKLGKRFGRALNGRLDTNIPTPKATSTKTAIDDTPPPDLNGRVKIKPDMIIIKKFEKAIRDGNTKLIDELSSMYELKAEVA